MGRLTPTTTELLQNGKPPPVKPTYRNKIHAQTLGPIPVGIPTPAGIPEQEPIQPVGAEPAKPPLKIAIIGTAPSSRDLAPFSDPSWTIWACSPGNMGVLPRVDVWFEIHSNLLWPECVSYGGPYLEWLKKQTFPIYMQDTSVVPNATPLPIQELIAEFGKFFFTSSFAYMLAMAIKAGAKEISLFGVDMASKDEYILQRSGGQFFMWEAARRGIRVNVPFESDLAQPPALYGYIDSTPFGRKLHVRQQELQTRIHGMRQEKERIVDSITRLEGAAEDLDYIKSIFGGLQT